VNAADIETPGFQPNHKIIQSILELREEQQPLFWMIEEAFLL
jgi:hypothetical protein